VRYGTDIIGDGVNYIQVTGEVQYALMQYAILY